MFIQKESYVLSSAMFLKASTRCHCVDGWVGGFKVCEKGFGEEEEEEEEESNVVCHAAQI